jgi:hypothetical protein
MPGVSRAAWDAIRRAAPERGQLVFGAEERTTGETDGWARGCKDYVVLAQRDRDWPDVVARMQIPREASESPATCVLVYFRAHGPAYDAYLVEEFIAPSVPHSVRGLTLDDSPGVAVTSESGGTVGRCVGVYRLGPEGAEKLLEQFSHRIEVETERAGARVTVYQRVIGVGADGLRWPRAFAWSEGRFGEGLCAAPEAYRSYVEGALAWLKAPRQTTLSHDPGDPEFVACMARLGQSYLALGSRAEALYWLTRAKLLADDAQAGQGWTDRQESTFTAEFELCRTDVTVSLAEEARRAQIARARQNHSLFRRAVTLARQETTGGRQEAMRSLAPTRRRAPARQPVSYRAPRKVKGK